MSAGPTGQTTPLVRVLIIQGLLVLLAEAAVFCLRGTSVYDEGGYLYEGWLSVSAGWMPFRDFFSRLPPFLHYVYGVGQALFGPGILVGRIESVVFMFAGLGIGMWLAARLAGPWASMLLVWLTVSNPFALNNLLHAYAYGPTTFFIVLTLALLIVPRPRAGPLFAAAATIAAILLCRHDQLPMALVLWVYMLWKYPAPLRMRIAAVAGSWLIFIMAMLPFYLEAPGNVLWTLTIAKLGPRLPFFPEYCRGVPLTPGALVWHGMMFLRYHAGPVLLLVPAVAAVAWARQSPGAHASGTDAPTREALRPFWLMLAAAAGGWLGYIPGAAATAGNVTYLLGPFLFWPIAVSAAGLFTRLVRRDGAGDLGPMAAAYRHALIAVAVFAVMMPVFTGPGAHVALSLQRPTALERIDIGARVLAKHIRPGATIFTVDDPHQFLEAGLVLPAPLTEQLFSYRETNQTDVVRQLHFYNDEMIREWLGGTAQYAVISAGSEYFMRCSGRFANGQRLYDLIHSLLAENYQLIAEEPESWAGPLRIYRRLEPPRMPPRTSSTGVAHD